MIFKNVLIHIDQMFYELDEMKHEIKVLMLSNCRPCQFLQENLEKLCKNNKVSFVNSWHGLQVHLLTMNNNRNIDPDNTTDHQSDHHIRHYRGMHMFELYLSFNKLNQLKVKVFNRALYNTKNSKCN